MVHFRKFRNQDAPGISQVWNESLTGRGAPRLRHSSLLENYVFSKTYFDPKGFFIAQDGDKIIGFAHAGFGPSSNGSSLDRTTGVTSLIAVSPAHQRKGHGSELLRRAESYLREAGSRVLQAGGSWPESPFYFGPMAGRFLRTVQRRGRASVLRKHGYVPARRSWCGSVISTSRWPSDGRFAGFATMRSASSASGVTSWYEECVLARSVLRFRAGRQSQRRWRDLVWEMDGIGYKWQMPAIGIVETVVSRRFANRRGKVLALSDDALSAEQFLALQRCISTRPTTPASRWRRSSGSCRSTRLLLIPMLI